MSTPGPEEARLANASAAEQQHGAFNFTNERGENIRTDLELVVDPVRGEGWQAYANQKLPAKLFQTCGLVNAEGSEEWANLVEHSMFVAAASMTIGHDLQARGIPIDMSTLERAAWAHDATKRSDVMSTISREDEAKEDLLPRLLGEFGYSAIEIAAAKNTGRLADRYIDDPVERMKAIKARSIEENIVGYADARTRGAHFATVEDARADSIAAKPKDESFFNIYWAPYYTAVEGYLQELAPGFNPNAITGDAIYATVEQLV